ncbi:hypothetical protein NNO_1762 [Hydrogenimonas sp.]|nr:hypothetical protein NNO_1762 [Hydrogenimonas sp.]
MTPSEIPIHDIKPLLPIPDVSIYFFVLLVATGVVAAAAVALYLRRTWRRRRKVDPRIAWLEKLERIDFDDPKRAAYIMTRYGRLLAEDKRREEIFSQLVPKLERYKYRKDVPPLDEETKRFMRLFVEMCKDAL